MADVGDGHCVWVPGEGAIVLESLERVSFAGVPEKSAIVLRSRRRVPLSWVPERVPLSWVPG